MPGKSLATILLFAAIAMTGFTTDGELHLGRSSTQDDAIPAHLELNRQEPTLSVKVTNRTGQPALLAGWLDKKLATAVVPGRSAMVTLTWDRMSGKDADLRLRLYADVDAAPRWSDPEPWEDHRVTLGRGKSYYPTPPPPPPPPPAAAPPSVGIPPPSATPSPGLPVTGTSARPYVVLAVGMLGFGGMILGLAWLLGRRSRT